MYPKKIGSAAGVLIGIFLGLNLSAAEIAVPNSDPGLPLISEPEQTELPAVYKARREALMREMGEGVAVIFSESQEDGDGSRPGSDFFYLTGVTDPDAVLVLAPKERVHREYLLLRNRDPEAERWTGEREPINEALKKKHGFEKIQRTTVLHPLLLRLAVNSPVLWQVSLHKVTGEKKPADLEAYGRVTNRLAGVSVKPLIPPLHRMRSRHSPGEIALMQRAIRITEAGFRAAVGLIRPGAFEGAIEAGAERVWKAAGARRPAYASIVGCGGNSTILHYPHSHSILRDGDLILMDMGAEYAHYAADITRTFPVNGRFTAEQRKIYQLVLDAQKTAFALVRPGAYMEDLDAAARKVISDAGYGDYFIHGLGHFVGLDVHDAGRLNEPLAPGMVITLEPGIYIPEKRLGVRIEDDVLVTETGARILSDGLPREPAEIEAWLARR
ncbi:MAG: Xaa-Pro aminopeptidase [Verrucomicrobiota bacterium]|jgi:Xaa-Pro aminopeptidase